jgi:hypothetical protein
MKRPPGPRGLEVDLVVDFLLLGSLLDQNPLAVGSSCSVDPVGGSERVFRVRGS